MHMQLILQASAMQRCIMVMAHTSDTRGTVIDMFLEIFRLIFMHEHALFASFLIHKRVLHVLIQSG
jgi:hypothetical protein